MLYGTGRLIVAGVDLCSVKFSLSVETVGLEGRAGGVLFAPQYSLNEALRAGVAHVLTASGRAMFEVTVTRVQLPRRVAFSAPWPPIQLEPQGPLARRLGQRFPRRRKKAAPIFAAKGLNV